MKGIFSRAYPYFSELNRQQTAISHDLGHNLKAIDTKHMDMVRKRVRSRPTHYISGLRDGKINVQRDDHDNDVNLRRPQNVDNKRRYQHDDFTRPYDRKTVNLDNSRTKRSVGKPYGKDWRDIYTNTPHVNSHHTNRSDLWQTSTLALLAAVVLMSALFLHLISDSNEKHLRRRRQAMRRPPIRVHKKTDEWIDDADDDLMEGDKTSNHASTAVSPDSRELPRPPAVYYHPYQPRLQQRQPHGKIPSTNVPSPGLVPAAAVSRAQPSGAAGKSQVPPPPIGESFQPTGNYYPLQPSGGVGTPYRPPTSGLTTPMSSRAIIPAESLSPSDRQTGEQAVRLGARVSPHQQQQQPREPSTEVQQLTVPQQRAMAAVPLHSDLSSFGSLTNEPSGDDPNVLHDRHHHSKHADEEVGRKDSPHAPRRRNPAAVKSPILLSPGTEDVAETLHRSRNSNIPNITEMLQETPRVANRRVLPKPTSALGLEDEEEQESHPTTATSAVSSTMAFASPPRAHASLQKNAMTPPEIPYVPSLGESRGLLLGPVHSQPPHSVNVDELQLFRMESGNVSHWEARVAEESSIIQRRVFSSFSSSEDDSTKEDAATDTIPSNDPRAGIDHKRDNLTKDTDAAMSLQGFVDFDKLELIEVIGGGGFGQVWKAKLRGTPVAVKVLTGSAQSKQVPKAVLQEFVAEINLLRGMQHPNICLYMGACIKPPNRAIVTELAANGSLWDALRLPLKPPYIACDGLSHDGWPMFLYEPDTRHGAPPTSGPGRRHLIAPPRYTWPWILVKKVAVGIARGMAYLHGGDPPVLHRDLKSANILLDESYNAKVCDFGLSRLKARERSMTGNCGTVQWMAPEVLASQAYNEKADIFSYGIICWELLSRQCPYDGMTPIQCALAVLNKNQRPEIPKWCPPALHALIRSCLKKNPDERPTFEEIIQTLDSIPDV